MRIDWVTTSSLATAAGTLVLALATFSSVRSANKAARTAERSLQVGLRPVLFPSRTNDPTQKIRWLGDHWSHLEGGRGSIEFVEDVLYMAMSLRNVGAGIAVIQGWRATVENPAAEVVRPDPRDFHLQTRDLYVPAGDSSFWQGAIRDPARPDRPDALKGFEQGALTVDLLYSDHEGGQRTISRFSLARRGEGDPCWMCSVVRHWNLDRHDPR